MPVDFTKFINLDKASEQGMNAGLDALQKRLAKPSLPEEIFNNIIEKLSIEAFEDGQHKFHPMFEEDTKHAIKGAVKWNANRSLYLTDKNRICYEDEIYRQLKPHMEIKNDSRCCCFFKPLLNINSNIQKDIENAFVRVDHKYRQELQIQSEREAKKERCLIL